MLASRRGESGAKVSLKLMRRASVVANICCDVVGDICGIVSGALGATIALLLIDKLNFHALFCFFFGFGNGKRFTVGGKALMKTLAISEANKIMKWVGILLDYKNWPLYMVHKKGWKRSINRNV